MNGFVSPWSPTLWEKNKQTNKPAVREAQCSIKGFLNHTESRNEAKSVCDTVT